MKATLSRKPEPRKPWNKGGAVAMTECPGDAGKTLQGFENTLQGFCETFQGSENTFLGFRKTILGSENTFQGFRKTILGSGNTFQGFRETIQGFWNSRRGLGQTCQGFVDLALDVAAGKLGARNTLVAGAFSCRPFEAQAFGFWDGLRWPLFGCLFFGRTPPL